ncbi:unnamed protein product [Amoebophrya sp. A120]|nr:unnamed protein product [Amoebophrya sp. A120]|eukprot:GSA120T00017124001.1
MVKPVDYRPGSLPDSRAVEDFQNQEIGSSHRGSIQYNRDIFAKQWPRTTGKSQRPSEGKFHSQMGKKNADGVSGLSAFELEKHLFKEKMRRGIISEQDPSVCTVKPDLILPSEKQRRALTAAKWRKSTQKVTRAARMLGGWAEFAGVDNIEEVNDEQKPEKSAFLRTGDVFPEEQIVEPLFPGKNEKPRVMDITFTKTGKLQKEAVANIPNLMAGFDKTFHGPMVKNKAGHKFLQRYKVKKPEPARAQSASGYDDEGPAMRLPCKFEDPSIQDVVAALEDMHYDQRTRGQPGEDLEKLMKAVFADRPEWRQRMAVLTKSQVLRRKILDTLPPGGRQVGSAVLGATHPWRSAVKTVEGRVYKFEEQNIWPRYATDAGRYSSDHNWPKADPVTGKLARDVLPSPSETMPQHPKLTNCPSYSFGKGLRRVVADPIHDIWTEVWKPQDKNSTPGPGDYTEALGTTKTPFTLQHNQEIVVLGANDKYACKGMLSPEITRLAQHTCKPVYSFPLQRLPDVAQGNLAQATAVKSDLGNLSPGQIYTQYGGFRVKDKNYGNRPARTVSLKTIDKALSAGRKYEVGGKPYR